MKIRYEIKRYIKDYKFSSLYIRNLLLLLVLILVPVAGAVSIAYYSYQNMQKKEIVAYNESVLSDTMSEVERIIKAAQTQLIYIGFNSNVELYMYDTEEIRELNYRVVNISDLIRLPVMSKEYIDSIYLYSRKSNKVITLSGISDFTTFPDKSMIEDFDAQRQEDKRIIRLTESIQSGFPMKMLSIFQEVNYGSLSAGIAVMNLTLPELVKELNLTDQTEIYITDGETILFSNDLDKISRTASDIPLYSAWQSSETPEGTVIHEKDCLSYRKDDKSGLTVISYFNLATYQNKLSAIRQGMLALIILMTAITVGIATVISVSLFSPIGRILSAIRESSGELFGEETLFKEKDEVMYILGTIQKTVNKKRDMEEELSERVRLLKKAQSVALQSQINPHFINNTLDTINWMAVGLLGGKNRISEMTTALSRMLRMALENTDTIISLKSEMEHCESYLQIQKTRYEDQFEVEWKIPEELYECRTIRIVLQPIVENAIYHGIKYLSNPGKITIWGERQENEVVLTVEDNGLGMTRAEVEQLNLSMQSDMIRESEHIGVANVNQRIKLYFGEEYGVSIESEEGIGTKVMIKLPPN